jgi:hypothetical protein
MHASDYLKSVGYSVESGSQFMWSCYGANAWYLDGQNSSAVVDRQTGLVYEVSVHDEVNHINHRWIHPEYLEGYVNESTDRGCEPWQAYDDVMYIRVDDEQEILKLVNGSK